MEFHERAAEQSPSASISREVVTFLKDVTGRGPTRVRTYLHGDCVLVLLREAHTRAEGSMQMAGRSREVAQSRVDLSEDRRSDLISIIEKHTADKVVGFLSSSQQVPSLLAFVFVLEKSPIVAAVPDEAAP